MFKLILEFEAKKNVSELDLSLLGDKIQQDVMLAHDELVFSNQEITNPKEELLTHLMELGLDNDEAQRIVDKLIPY